MSLSSDFFLFPNSRLIGLTWPCQWIVQLEQHETDVAAKRKNGTGDGQEAYLETRAESKF